MVHKVEVTKAKTKVEYRRTHINSSPLRPLAPETHAYPHRGDAPHYISAGGDDEGAEEVCEDDGEEARYLVLRVVGGDAGRGGGVRVPEVYAIR